MGDHIIRSLSVSGGIRILVCDVALLTREICRLHGASPTVSIALGRGLAGGALMGSLAQMGVDKGFMKDVEEAMPPNSSALFFLLRDDEPDAAIAALEPYQGTVYHTSLSPEDEAMLREALLR